MEHSFDIDIAQAYGVIPAILLKNLHFWIEKNKANGVHYYRETWWAYNSVKAFSELFPYLTYKQVAYGLRRLIDEGLLITGIFADDPLDRTTWYALTDKAYSILQNCKLHLTKLSNRKETPITNISLTDINKKEINKEKRFVKPSVSEVAVYCRERKNKVDAQQFIDFYESKGWKVGNAPMKDWKAAVRTWERRNSKPPVEQNFTERKYTLDELRSIAADIDDLNGDDL